MAGEDEGQETQTTPDQTGAEGTAPDSGGDDPLVGALDDLDESRVDAMAADEEPTPSGEEGGEPSPSAEGQSPDAAESDETGEEAPSGEDVPGSTPEHLRWQADGDPEGTYRDAQGRLHDAQTGEYRKGETVEPPEQIRKARDLSDEEVEDFFSEEGEGEEGGEPDVEPITFTSETEDGEEEFELLVEDPEARDVISEKLEKAEEVESVGEMQAEVEEERQEVQQSREELLAVQAGIESDPSGYILDHLDPQPETVKTLAKDLLAFSDEAFQEVASALEEWRMDGTKRRSYKLDRREELIEHREDRNRAISQKVGVQKIGRKIRRDFIPADADPETARQMFDDIVREIEAHAEEHGELPAVDNLDEIPGVERRLQLYGVDPTASANGSGPEEEGESDQSNVTEAKPAGEQEEELMERAEEARRIGAELRRRRERKKDAASTSPSGAGATPSGVDLKDATLDEAFDELERRTG